MKIHSITFTKMTGAGNDFIVIDDRKELIKRPPAFARKVCDRRWGIGADGLILLRKHPLAKYEMRYYNADGSYGGMCGNGGRCIAQFAIDNKIAPKEHTFFSVDHIYHARAKGKNTIALTMKNPSRIRFHQSLTLKDTAEEIHYSFIDTGSPHVVIDVDSVFNQSLDSLDIERIGRAIRFHQDFSPAGANVNFITRKETTIYIRTYERGVEAETLACGTGTVASAIVARLQWNIQPPVTVIPKSRQKLQVRFSTHDGIIENVVLIGPAETVFTGKIPL